MIYYINARNIPKEAKEVWFVVRSLQIYKPKNDTVYKHVSILSPNLELFIWGRKITNNNDWTYDNYRLYRENFIKQLKNDKTAMNIIKYLRGVKNSLKKDIYLACYCANFQKCHLNILKELID